MARPKLISKMEMADIVAEYNELTGKTIKKFANRAKAEESLQAARDAARTKKKEPAPGREPVKAKGQVFKSVRVAFAELGLPENKHRKFRKELKEAGELVFKHEGQQVKFTVVKEAA